MFRWLGIMAAGCAGAMGLGGGGILLLCLNLSGIEPRRAQGINLLMLIPVGLAGLWFHRKNGCLCSDRLRPLLTGGIPGAVLGLLLSGRMPGRLRKAGIGVLFCVMAVREFRAGLAAGRKEGWRLFPEKNGE